MPKSPNLSNPAGHYYYRTDVFNINLLSLLNMDVNCLTNTIHELELENTRPSHTLETHRYLLKRDLRSILAFPFTNGWAHIDGYGSIGFRLDTLLGHTYGALGKQIVDAELVTRITSQDWLSESHLALPNSRKDGPWSELGQFAAWSYALYEMSCTDADKYDLNPSPLSDGAALYREIFVENAAYISTLLLRRGVKLTPLLSYLYSWNAVFGPTLYNMFRALKYKANNLGSKRNEAHAYRLRQSSKMMSHHLNNLTEAIVNRIMSGEERWDRHIQKLSIEYIEMLKGLLETYEDVLDKIGDPYTADMVFGGKSVRGLPASYLHSLGEYARNFYADMTQVMQAIEEERYFPSYMARYLQYKADQDKEKDNAA